MNLKVADPASYERAPAQNGACGRDGKRIRGWECRGRKGRKEEEREDRTGENEEEGGV